ncbi:MAG: transcription termination/antitermination factor NusG [Candidatus Scalindua sp. AMX11]|nr:MAG: transcription termination/antitermination factor NusG [Candidatus Scalindua sp.]NOG85475.1 transcription termination/antitermination factor NusG [Planctomycetota bacterium]RZV90275.1 MAG: transcription termination/antitermination factor NusG [Candidatus Scalindua sp. SCAELEC01]TDE64684.1 MAG: transcription termination/antitermination factor NusG [Candidatus Scalindua sp. AMX11]GJQ57363.1 MAG: transcription termination/antitermination protein NusG [Candidatus Scalindua sp.]
MGKKWFVLRVQSNKEDRVKRELDRVIKLQDLGDLVSSVLVPSEKVTEIKGGKKRVVERKIYPGYVIMELEVDEEGQIPDKVCFVVRETYGASDFVGGKRKPIAMTDREVEMLLQTAEAEEEKPRTEIGFCKGDKVRIKEGPFENYDGVVEEVFPASGCVKIILTIFGRPTPVELEYWQAEVV